MTENSPAKPIWYYPANIFWNFAEGRMRFLWRVLILVFITSLLAAVVGFVFFLLPLNLPAPELIGQIQVGFLTVLAVWLTTRFVDRRKFSDTGIFFNKNWWVDLGFGAALGAVLMALIFIVELAAGWVSVRDVFVSPQGTSFAFAILGPLVLFIGVSLSEELLFRGYLLLNLAEALNWRFIDARTALLLSWLLTSALFGLAHASNPGASLISSFNIALAGIFVGLGYVLTGSLAIPLGIHFTWNFFQGNVFGFPVSGTAANIISFIGIEQGGPNIWTGGAFGPEAGIIGLLAMLLGTALTVVWVRSRHGKVALHTSIAEPPQSSI